MQELHQAKQQHTYNHHSMVHTPVGSIASFTDSLGAPLGQTDHSHQPGLTQGFRTSSQPDARQRTSAEARSAGKRLSADPPYGFDDQEKRARLPSWPSDSLNPFNTADAAAVVVRATGLERPPLRVPQLAFSSSSPDLPNLPTPGLGSDPPTPWHPPPISSTLSDANAMAPTVNLGIKPLNITPQATESPPNDLSNHMPSTPGTQHTRTGSLSTSHQQSQPPMQPVPFGRSPSSLQAKSPLTGLLQQAPLLCNRTNTNLVPQHTSSTQQQLHTNQSGSDDTAHSQGPAKARTPAATSTANNTPMATPTFKLTSPGVENTCAFCKATSTSGCWRRGWELPPTPGSPPRFANLCNKCGLRHKHGRLGVPAYTKLPKTLPTRSDTSNIPMAMGQMPPRPLMTFTGGFSNPIPMTSNLPVPIAQCASQLTRTPTPPTPSTMPAPNPSPVHSMDWGAGAGHEHGMVLLTHASRQSEGGVAPGAGLAPLDVRGSPAGGGTSGASSPDVYESPGEGILKEGVRMGEEDHGHAWVPWDQGLRKSAGCELVPFASAGAGMVVYEAHHDVGVDSDQGGTGTVLMKGPLASMSGGAASSWPDTSDGMATWLQPAPSMNPYQLPGDVMMMVMSTDGAATNTTTNNGGTPRFTSSSHIGPDAPQTHLNTYMTGTWTTPALTVHPANDNGSGHMSDSSGCGTDCAGLAAYAPPSTANHHLMQDVKCALLSQQQAVYPASPHKPRHHLMAVTTGVPPFRTVSMSMAAAALLAFKSGGNVDGGDMVGVENEAMPKALAPPLNVDNTGRAPAPGSIPSEPAPEQQDPTAITQVATNQQTQESMAPPPAPGPPPGPPPGMPASRVGPDTCPIQSDTQQPPAPDPFKDPAASQQQQQQANRQQLRGSKVHLGMSKVKVNPPWGWTRQQLTAWLESISCQVLGTQLYEQQVDSTALIVLAAMAPDMATLHNILAQEFRDAPLGARLRLAAGIMHFKSQLPPSRTLQGMMA